MVNNIIEAWYWTLLLVVLVGVCVYYSIHTIKEMWTALKKHREEGEDTIPEEMSLKPYSKRIVIIHWLTVLLLIAGWYLGEMLDDARNAHTATLAGYYAHVLVGGTVLLLTLLRWTFRNMDGAPPLGYTVMDLVARGVHYALYFLLVLLGATGFMTALTSGVGVALIKVDPALLPEKYFGPSVVPHVAHEITMYVLMVVAAAHIAGALMHQFILKDGLMKRMSLHKEN